MKFTVIILDENQGWNIVTTFGPYDTREIAEAFARQWFDEMDSMIPEIAMGYSYDVKAVLPFDTAKARVAAEILIQTRRDPFMRSDNWDGYMGSEVGCV